MLFQLCNVIIEKLEENEIVYFIFSRNVTPKLFISFTFG